MAVRVVTLPFLAEKQMFDEASLQQISQSHNILTCRDHFFSHGNKPFLALVLEIQSREKPSSTAKVSTKNLCQSLNNHDQQLFQKLLAWRSSRAEQEGVPAYVILTNREMLSIVETKPRNKTHLQTIPGIGKKKVERHGQQILDLIGQQQVNEDQA